MDGREVKPLNWSPAPGIGYSVARRPDGGMNFTFTSIDPETLQHWHDFAIQHLEDSDRLTRNLYDLRALDDIPDKAIQMAVEANSDPSTRNIRLAVVVKNKGVEEAIYRIAGLTGGSGVEMKVFTDIDEAEAWLNRPLNILI